MHLEYSLVISSFTFICHRLQILYFKDSMKMDALNLLRLTSVRKLQRVSDEQIMGRVLACCLENGQMGGVWNTRYNG